MEEVNKSEMYFTLTRSHDMFDYVRNELNTAVGEYGAGSDKSKADVYAAMITDDVLYLSCGTVGSIDWNNL